MIGYEWNSDTVISDQQPYYVTAELLEGDPSTKSPRGRVMLCFLFVSVSSALSLLEKLNHTWISERDFNKGSSAGVSTGLFETFTDFFFLQFTTAGLVCCLPITRLQIPASSKTVGRNKYEVKDSETSRSPRFVLVYPLKLDL